MITFKVVRALLVLGVTAHASSGSASGLRFEPNVGQTNPAVSFLSRWPGHTLFLSPVGATLRTGASVWKMQFIGANPDAAAIGVDPLETRSHYLIGGPANWRTDVGSYSRVEYRDIYPGVDLVYYGDQGRLKYDLVIHPGADPSQVTLRFEGADPLRFDANGDLVLETAQEEWRHANTESYQLRNGARSRVGGRFVAVGPNEVALAVGHYDRMQPLVITYSTYLGGSGQDTATSIAVDAAGNAYITGWTESTDFPETAGVRLGNPGGVDAYVAKLSPAGKLLYLTYLGGLGDDRAFGIAVDSSGSAVVAGWTYSTNFPVVNAAQPVLGGGRDGFVAKLNAAGSAVVFSTFFGGIGADSANAVALDPQGNIYVAGETASGNFPVLSPVQSQIGGSTDAFVSKYSSTGARLYSTFLGGIGDDRATAIAVDGSGYAYITGSTYSVNFPAVNALQSKLGGGQDAFAAKIGPAGNTLIYSTYLGGSGGKVGAPETGNGIAVDSSGCVYIAGATSSANFPMLNPLKSSLSGSEDAFVLKLSAAGNALVYSTYLGGSSVDFANAIAIDSAGRASVAGYTASTDFPVANSAQTSIAGGYDAFIARLSTTGGVLEMGTYLGGTDSDSVYGIALDASGNTYVAGQTLSSDFPTAGAIQLYKFSGASTFVARLGTSQPPQILSLTPSSGSGASQTFSIAVSAPNVAADVAIYVLINAQLAGVNACQVAYDRASNLLWLIADNGTTWITAGTVGSGSIVSNSQCSLDPIASSVSPVGSTLTLNVRLTFKSAFSGTKNIYLALDQAGLSTGWKAAGTWTNASAAPSVVSLTPSSGSGVSQTFSVAVSAPNVTADVAVYLLVNAQLVGVNACQVAYDRASNLLWLISDNGTTWFTAGTVGSGSTVSNSQCSLDPVGSSVSAAGTILTLNVKLLFKPAFSGTKNIYVAVDQAGVGTGWQATGTWTSASAAPSVVSLTPSSGSGVSQTFSIAASAPNVTADIAIYLLVNAQLVGVNACQVAYDRSSNLLWLIADNGTTWLTAGTVGSGSTVSNSQCSLDPISSTVSTAGTILTLNVKLIFKPAFSGTKNIYVALDQAGVGTGWRAIGSWKN